MKVLSPLAFGVALSMAPLAATTLPRPATSDFRTRGLESGYNLDYADALAQFEHAIALDSNDATAHRLAAATIWMRILFLQGAIIVEEYLGQARGNTERPTPPAELAAQFDRHLRRAIALAERLVRLNPSDADAHYQLGAAAALRTTYNATILGKVVDSLGTGRRAYSEHERTLALDPQRKDAALIPGMYRYAVANLSLPMRLMARLAGFEGGRDAGVRLVEAASQFESPARINARLTLLLIYNRERRFDDALTVARQLQQQFPRNRLLWLEEGSTALRANLPREALVAIEHGLALFAKDTREKAFGEEANWRLHRGTALLLAGDSERAQRDLQFAAIAEAPVWIRRQARERLVDKAR